MTNPTLTPSGIPGGTLLPVYYVSPYQFVTCMRWHTRVPTHTRTEHIEPKDELTERNGTKCNKANNTKASDNTQKMVTGNRHKEPEPTTKRMRTCTTTGNATIQLKQTKPKQNINKSE